MSKNGKRWTAATLLTIGIWGVTGSDVQWVKPIINSLINSGLWTIAMIIGIVMTINLFAQNDKKES